MYRAPRVSEPSDDDGTERIEDLPDANLSNSRELYGPSKPGQPLLGLVPNRDADLYDSSLPNSPGPQDVEGPSRSSHDDVRNREGDAFQRSAADGENFSAEYTAEQASLHLAVYNDDIHMAKYFAEKGTDLEAAAVDGKKPLYIAAEFGYFDIAELLLRYGASVEALNAETHQTALYRSVERGHFDIAKLLLSNGAEIDARSQAGLTPLFCAVSRGDADIVQYLLEHGADKEIELEDGRTVKDFAKGDPAINILLLSDQVLQGPSIRSRARTNPERRFIFAPSLPEDQIYKQYACHGFDATIIDFFLGEREQRIHATASVYEILYGKGPEAIMDEKRLSSMGTQRQQLRWYHLPANNMEWVEVLINRIFAEKSSGSEMLDHELRSQLALTSTTGRQYRTLTAQSSSFMRPLCQPVNVKGGSLLEQSAADHLVLFMPYLHFETIRGYEEMISHIKDAKKPPNARKSKVSRRVPPTISTNDAPGHEIKPDETQTKISTDAAESVESNESAARKRSKWTNIRHGTEKLLLTFPGLKKQLALESPRKTDVERNDLEKGRSGGTSPATKLPPVTTLDPKGHENSHTLRTNMSTEAQVKVHDAKVEQNSKAKSSLDISPVDKLNTEEGPRPGAGNLSQEHKLTKAEIPATDNGIEVSTAPMSADTNTILPRPMDNGTNNLTYMVNEIAKDVLEENENHAVVPRAVASKGEQKLAGIPEDSQARTEYNDRPPGADFERLTGLEARNSPMSLSRLDEILIKAYLLPSTSSQLSPLQLRRTLDQYFYTDLSNTHQRDTDQVVLRYTKSHGQEHKIFMVDQLWLWILNDDTVISCFPHRWDTSSADGYGMPLHPNLHLSSSIPPPGPRPGIVERQNSHRLDKLVYSLEKSPGLVVPEVGHSHRNNKELLDYGHMRTKNRKESGPSPLVAFLARGSQRKKDKMGKEEAHLGSSVRKMKESGPPSSIERENKRRRQAFLQEDPLNIHQTILEYIKLNTRTPITSATELAKLIASSCTDVFDQYKILPDFQFFDFFESSIGDIIEKEAQCFQSFTESVQSDSNTYPRIREEVKLLVEIKDIRDELRILDMVLNDQMQVMAEFYRAMDGKEQNLASSQTKVLRRHLARLRHMDKLAETAYQSLNGLLDLKQKQANVSEAASAREQAEIAAQHAEHGAEHARLATEQAKETARQGRTVLLFTVVTIIFLPLSFMAAFFAISIDSFPANENGRLPMDYVLKYMLTISAAISIPFILIAFNQDRITNWLRGLGRKSFWWSCIFCIPLVLLPVVWTSNLASNIKVAITIVVVLLLILAALGHGIHTLASTVFHTADSNSYKSGSELTFSD